MTEPKNVNLRKIIKIIGGAYPDDMIELYHEEPDRLHGDSLAEFIEREVRETFEEDNSWEDQLEEAHRVMVVARDEMDAIVTALEKEIAQAPKKEQAPDISKSNDDFHDDNLRHFERLMREKRYIEFCREFCHEGLMAWYPHGFRSGVQVSVCSDKIEAETEEEGVKKLAEMLFQRMKDGGDEGC